MKQTIVSITTQFSKFLWKLFLNGLITVLPLLLTMAIFNMLFKFVKALLEPIRTIIMSSAHFIPSWLQWIPHIDIVSSFILIFFLGTILNIFVFRSILNNLEQWFSKIPLVRPIYSGMKQLVQAFGNHDKGKVQQVVLVQFPHPGTHTVGFVTGQVDPHLAPRQDIVYASVYVPTTPTPTSGFYLIVPQKDLITLDLTRQEAITLIVSVGMIQPKEKSETPHQEG